MFLNRVTKCFTSFSILVLLILSLSACAGKNTDNLPNGASAISVVSVSPTTVGATTVNPSPTPSVPPTVVPATLPNAQPTVTPVATSVPVKTNLMPFDNGYFHLQVPADWQVEDPDPASKGSYVAWTADATKVYITALAARNDRYDAMVGLYLNSNKGWKTMPLQAASLQGLFGILDDAKRTPPAAQTSAKVSQNVAARCFFPLNGGTGDYEFELSTDYRGADFQEWLTRFKTLCQSFQPKPLANSTPITGTAIGKLVYSTNSIVETPKIFLSNPDGSERVQLAADGHTPIFSPDGQQVAYLQSAPLPNGETEGEAAFTQYINTVKLDGSNKQTLCRMGSAAQGLLRWSPRGRYIAGTVGQTGPTMVQLCDVQTKKATTAFGTSNTPALKAFDWTADGNNAVWQSFTSRNPIITDFYYGDPDKAGTGATKLTTAGDSTSDSASVYGPTRISPDGKTIAIASTKLFFVSVPGQKSPLATKKFDLGGRLKSVAWSPDSKTIAATVCNANCSASSLVLVNLANGQTTTLSDNADWVDWTRP